MKKRWAALAAFVFGVSVHQASAADLAVKAAPSQAIAPAAAASWTGWYVGLEGGWAHGRFRQTNQVSGVSEGWFNQDGGLVGGTLGYNWQAGTWVYGLETDLAWADVRGTQACGRTLTNTCGTDIRAYGTLRGRLGALVLSNTMLYATGGLAYADIHAWKDNGVTTGDNWRAAWTVGAGAEAMILPRWSVKLEYLYSDFPGTGDDVSRRGGNARYGRRAERAHDPRRTELAFLRVSRRAQRVEVAFWRPPFGHCRGSLHRL